MLVIRKKQMDVFEQAALRNFEDSMVDHVKEFFPNHYRVAGGEVVLNVVRYGIKRAETYEFTSERNVCLYITVMFMLGSNFDKDFMFPWAVDILEKEDVAGPSERADELADKALDYMKEIGGPENKYINRAFLTLRKELPYFKKKQDIDNFDQYMKEKLKMIYHMKYETLGEDIVQRLINEGINMASKYKISEKRGHALCVLMMFFMVSPIDNEPFLPWIKAILEDESLVDQTERIDHLYEETITYTEKWLENPQQRGQSYV